jgi:hypothetical protein
MAAQNFSQSRMYEMRRRVIAPGRVALFHIDLRNNFIAKLERPVIDFDFVNNHSADREKRVSDG